MNFHPSIFKSLKKFKTYRNFKKYLKKLGLTKREQRILTRCAKSLGQELH